eukprot:TRINITY_DN4914_c0_g1_i4.p1 TRINITY_DN4914_c0_g1~~TRINITY_DN4914_c0_g1_i4.p1  ORF type:complete len:628 (-),score=65.44 TRINITY_DN4914_c0_g1_i4:266-2035(-)
MSTIKYFVQLAVYILARVACVQVNNYDREINLSGFNVVIQETIDITNDGKDPLSSFTLCYSSFIDDNTALSTISQDKGQTSLTIQPSTAGDKQENVTCILVNLKDPVKKGQQSTLKTFVVATHVIAPFPAEITQTQSQSALFHDYLYVLSPYQIKSQTTQVKLPGPRVHTYTQSDKVDKEGSTLKYGPYDDVHPFKLTPLKLHYENNKPFIQIRSLVREIQISHWGNVYVDEQYDIMHAGAKVTGMWSRLDYTIGKTSKSGFDGFTALLPAGAHTVYYRDDIGNVSTSNVRFEKDKVVAQLRTRYPLFGGWASKFLFGYSLPLSKVMSYTKDGSRKLQMKFASPFIDEHVIDYLEVRVVFPEGASHITYSVPFSTVEEYSKKWSYLDTGGRNVLILQKGNVVRNQNLDFVVSYQFPPYDLLHEPMLLVIAYFVLFLTFIVGSRIDLSVGKDQSAKKRAKVFDLVQKLESILSDHKKVVKDIEQWSAAVGSGGSRTEAERVKSKAENALKQDIGKLSSTLQLLKDTDTYSAKGFDNLLEKNKQLLEKAVQLLSMSLAGDSPAKNLSAIKASVAQLKSEVQTLSQNLFSGY